MNPITLAINDPVQYDQVVKESETQVSGIAMVTTDGDPPMIAIVFDARVGSEPVKRLVQVCAVVSVGNFLEAAKKIERSITKGDE